MNMPNPEIYKPKFHCRRQSGMNFDYVTVNGVNSNDIGENNQRKIIKVNIQWRQKYMLTEQRFDIILKLLEEKKSVTVTELRELLDASESTVRRDITALDKAGKLTKVFGGAVALNHKVTAYEPTVAQKLELNKEEKQKIAKYAASLITPDDFVYLDAGTITGLMLEYLKGVKAAFVTNAVSHAQTLAKMGIRVYLIGGELKSSTEAVVGSQAMQMIQMYHFTKGFFGTNGITRREGFTTPDTSEAIVKSTAMKQCKDVYILTDKSKFGEVSSVTFGGFTDAKILTEEIPEEYEDSKNILKVK